MQDLGRLRDLLQGIAAEQGTVPYQGILRMFDLPSPALRKLAQGLEILQWQDAVLGRPALTSVVVQKNAPYPRAGFFRTARALGQYDGPDTGTQAQMWHQHQLEQVWAHYGAGTPD